MNCGFRRRVVTFGRSRLSVLAALGGLGCAAAEHGGSGGAFGAEGGRLAQCGETRLVEVAMWAGECVGECIGRVSIGASESSGGGCEQVTFAGYGWRNTKVPIRTHRSTLTPEGLRQVRELALALDGVSLQKRYGCPDCNDGGAAQIVLLRGGIRSEHTYEVGRPPEELRAVHHFALPLLRALTVCRSNELVTVADDCVLGE